MDYVPWILILLFSDPSMPREVLLPFKTQQECEVILEHVRESMDEKAGEYESVCFPDFRE